MRPGEPREVDRRLGLARALEDAALLRAQREDVTRAARGRAAPSCGSIATWIVRARSWAEMPVDTPSRASIETVNAVPSGVSLWSRHRAEVELVAALGRQAEADEPACRASP